MTTIAMPPDTLHYQKLTTQYFVSSFLVTMLTMRYGEENEAGSGMGARDEEGTVSFYRESNRDNRVEGPSTKNPQQHLNPGMPGGLAGRGEACCLKAEGGSRGGNSQTKVRMICGCSHVLPVIHAYSRVRGENLVRGGLSREGRSKDPGWMVQTGKKRDTDLLVVYRLYSAFFGIIRHYSPFGGALQRTGRGNSGAQARAVQTLREVWNRWWERWRGGTPNSSA